MSKHISRENWVKDSTNKDKKRQADKVLNKIKNANKGKKFMLVPIPNTTPQAYKEIEIKD